DGAAKPRLGHGAATRGGGAGSRGAARASQRGAAASSACPAERLERERRQAAAHRGGKLILALPDNAVSPGRAARTAADSAAGALPAAMKPAAASKARSNVVRMRSPIPTPLGCAAARPFQHRTVKGWLTPGIQIRLKIRELLIRPGGGAQLTWRQPSMPCPDRRRAPPR